MEYIMNYCLGIDIGGTTVKASVFDVNGRELGTAASNTAVISDEPGKVERDLALTWKGILEVIQGSCDRAGIKPSAIDFISTTGHGKGAYLRFSGEEWPSVGIVSNDTRAARLAASLGTSREYTEVVLPRITQPLWPSHSSAMLSWMQREQPDRFSKIDQVLFSKDFITTMLTGRHVTDYTVATGSGLYRTDDNQVDREVLRFFGVSQLEGALPEALPSHEVAGSVRREVAAATGLREGTPVTAGLFDVNAAALACAIEADREMGLVVGTWNIALATTTNPDSFRSSWADLAVQAHCIPGQWMIHEGSPTSASNLEWWVQKLFTLGGPVAWERINELVAETERTGVWFFPYIYGSHGNPDATGTLVGLRSDSTPGEVIRAIYEGITYQLREHALPISRQMPRIDHLRLAGGAKRSAPWVQIITDAFNLALSLSPTEEIGALGAVISGAVGVGAYPDYPAAVRGMTLSGEARKPRAEKHSHLDERFQQFLRLRAALDGAWEAAV
ncbi:MAG: hypothetical protein EA427_05270 [Spirochaetaceae bacterium]|nr:MAG: hypothetical protein EA427_05270 [Spirochaetaceae bacterium]